MSVWGKILTAVRGGVNEAAESAIDQQSVRILDQEMRDAEQALRKARSDLAGIMASTKILTRRIEENKAKEAKDTQSTRNALSIGREDLAQGLAQRIANVRNELKRDEEDLARQTEAQQRMYRTIQETETRITQMKREIENVKANESMLRAQSAVAHSQAGVNSRLGNAMDSLERIKKRQEHLSARIEAGAELAGQENGSDLDRRLLEAGISGSSTSADDILAQLRGPSVQTNDVLKELSGPSASPEPVADTKEQ